MAGVEVESRSMAHRVPWRDAGAAVVSALLVEILKGHIARGDVKGRDERLTGFVRQTSFSPRHCLRSRRTAGLRSGIPSSLDATYTSSGKVHHTPSLLLPRHAEYCSEKEGRRGPMMNLLADHAAQR